MNVIYLYYLGPNELYILRVFLTAYIHCYLRIIYACFCWSVCTPLFCSCRCILYAGCNIFKVSILFCTILSECNFKRISCTIIYAFNFF